MDLEALKAELDAGHPVTGAYSASHVNAAAEMNVPNCSRPRDSVTGSDVLNAIDVAEFNGQTAEEKARVWNILHLGALDPWGVEADLLMDIFGAGSDTIQALAALRVEAISRAQELGLGTMKAGYVQRARIG